MPARLPNDGIDRGREAPCSPSDAARRFIKLTEEKNRLSSRLKQVEVELKQSLSEQALSILGHKPLSSRQAEVLSLILLRKRNKEIADMINVSERTVKFHVTQILRKYGVLRRDLLY